MNNLKVTNPYLNNFTNRYYNLETIDPLTSPKIVDINTNLADSLGLSYEDDTFIDLLNGKLLLDGSNPFAMAYAGHQFGYKVPQLGDGRAINIGTIDGYHLQLKGAGLTKYSRQGDGRAVLRSSIREYLMSEAMHGLGIPTTRALAIISSNHPIYREYKSERGAIVLRASKSWIRIGSFEYFYDNGGSNAVKKLLDFVIDEDYKHLQGKENRYKDFYFELIDRSAKLVAHWQSIGFMHGVLNTDNTSAIGLTIDYGPYAFMDQFKKDNICNHTDREGRYSFENQPQVVQWNLKVLANTLSGLVAQNELDEINNMFIFLYNKYYFENMASKIGIFDQEGTNINTLIEDLLALLEHLEVDYTQFFYQLSIYDKRSDILNMISNTRSLATWFDRYESILKNEQYSKDERQEKLRKVNPKYVLKNYMIQEAIDKANHDDFSLVKDLMKIAQNPYAQHSELDRYAVSTPQDYSNQRLSCSS